MGIDVRNIGKLEVKPRDLGGAEAILKGREEKATLGVEQAEWNTGLMMGQEGLGELWHKATLSPSWEREFALLKVVELSGQSASSLKAAWGEKQAVATAFASFGALCQVLGSAQGRDRDRSLGPVAQNVQLRTRYGMEQHVEVVERAIKAAGDDAVGKFPLRQLGLIKSNLVEQIQALERKGASAITPLLSAKDVDTAPKAAAALARLLDRRELAKDLVIAGERSGDPAQFTKLLGAFAMLVDQASSAPDYKTTGAGWHHPRTRIDYRNRDQNPEVLYVAEPRIKGSLEVSREIATEIGYSRDPLEVLGDGLVLRFLDEIGKTQKSMKGWMPTLEGITDALHHELLLPLRALNETTAFMATGKHEGQKMNFDAVVADVTRAVVEGRYPEWRSGNPFSKAQLSILKAPERKKWLADNVSMGDIGSHGGTLKSREEDGLDLFWLTKIGGPSHGFDYGGHCLLPLLANARTRAIVVEDQRWPDHPAARAYLRLISTPDGKPLLYLEPTQRDFGHRARFVGSALSDDFSLLILRHAMEKAKLLGLPLSIDSRLADQAKEIGARGRHVEKPVYLLAASGGVLEASDTLTDKHDWLQNFDEKVHPTPRFLIAPARK